MAITAPNTLVLCGPTGVGKTALALDVAEQLGTDILSADSRQVYRGLDIGTAKPTAAERARVRHHWIDQLDVGEPTSAGAFSREADAYVARCHGEGRPALAVGGSTLYVDAVIRGLADLPEVSENVASDVAVAAKSAAGRARLFEELTRADPASASTLDATKGQRLARLVGLLRETGQAPSQLWAQGAPPARTVRVVVLDLPRDELYRRIERRVDEMLDAGLLDENRRLLADGHRLDTPPLRTIGYHEPIRYLEGEIDEGEMVRLLKQNTRRYAKRQLTWFRRYPEALWVDASDGLEGVMSAITD
ncbi:MAG TPA: tRNA (adenosine(37)-N6)-dimethylallyltransferase MiaA [Rubricoccaceae bacterium]|jgi:tRNA dimethylallyltransferase